MRTRVRELLTAHAAAELLGREPELSALCGLLGEEAARIAHVHGAPGIGKSMLLRTFLARARSSGASVALLDCREIEPTPRGLLASVANAVDAPVTDADALADCLGERQGSMVIALDAYETFRLMDTWLRLTFVPLLPDNVLFVMAGRHQPAVGWLTGGWQALTLNLPLGPLARQDAARLLASTGADPARCGRVIDALHGHPLALRLAACACVERPALDLSEDSLSRIMNQLTRMYLEDVPDPVTRRLLEGAAVARRVTVPLLKAMYPDVEPDKAYDRLCALAFVEVANDGLQIHDALQDALAHALRARDPQRYRDYRRRAWGALVLQTAQATRAELWRYTADMLYLIENPVVREAFFPSGANVLAVEQARPDDAADIHKIAGLHEPPAAVANLYRWWNRYPQWFMVVRNQNGGCEGFCCRFDPIGVDADTMAADPLVRAWQADLDERPLVSGEHALFVRRWLSRKQGEGPGDVQACIWLDLKRTYMEMRPDLRRVYLTLTDMAPYAAAAQQLGFRVLPGRAVRQDGQTYQCAVLDFGPDSVDGWLSRLAAVELGLPSAPDLFDADARELLIDDRRIGLTPLQFGVMAYLYRHPGKAVSREVLLHHVWHTDYAGWSNVVDTVVASLRRKLGDHARCIETVTGVGYRYRKERRQLPTDSLIGNAGPSHMDRG